MTMKNVNEKDFTLTVFVNFSDPYKAQRSVLALSALSFSDCPLEVSLNMRISLFVSSYVHKLMHKDIESEQEALIEEGKAQISIVSRAKMAVFRSKSMA